MILLDRLFCDKIFVKISFGIQIVKKSISEGANYLVPMIDILLKYILGYEFFNALDAQSDFDKRFVTKKLVK